MGDAIGFVVAAAIVGVAVAAVLYGLGVRQRRRDIGSRAIPTLGIHDEDAIAARATQFYRIGQRAVRLLERLDADISVAGMMSHEDRAEAKAIVKSFYET